MGSITSAIKNLRKSRKAFKIGVVLLVINVPLGWFFLALGGHLSSKYHNPVYIYLFSGLYGLTWAMLGVGLLLSGLKGMEKAKKKLSRLKFWRNTN